MSAEENFQQAVTAVNALTTKPSDADLLEIYGLYKQATVGDVNTSRPGMLDFKGKLKWDSWNGYKGMANDEAKRKYVEKANALGAI